MHALDAATADLDPPFAVVDLDAFDANAADLVRRAGGTPVRLASKSVRCRALVDRALGAGLRGILAFTLPEALWLAGPAPTTWSSPTRPSTARRCARSPTGAARERITLMVDCREHLDLIARPPARARCACASTSTRAGGRSAAGVRIGAKRSPLRTPAAGGGAGARDRRPAGAGAGRADDVRGADRRRRRPPARQPAAGRRRCGRCSAPRRASWPTAAPRSSRRCARSRRCGSSTAAAPARSSARPPSPR